MPWAHITPTGVDIYRDRPSRIRRDDGALVVGPSTATLAELGWVPADCADPPEGWETNPYIHRTVEVVGEPAVGVTVRYVHRRRAPDG